MYVQIVFNAELTPQLVKDKIEYLTKEKIERNRDAATPKLRQFIARIISYLI